MVSEDYCTAPQMAFVRAFVSLNSIQFNSGSGVFLQYCNLVWKTHFGRDLAANKRERENKFNTEIFKAGSIRSSIHSVFMSVYMQIICDSPLEPPQTTVCCTLRTFVLEPELVDDLFNELSMAIDFDIVEIAWDIRLHRQDTNRFGQFLSAISIEFNV